MDYQVSARKYRPGSFEDVIGQMHVVQTLMNAIGAKRIAHAFLFSGSRGVGKTTIARILAKALNCEQGPTSRPCGSCANCVEITAGTSVDVVEIDGASNTSVDDVREIRENVKFAPFRGQYRVFIIDEVHMLSNSAFNALLKTLEEPPSHVVFIFATTEIHKIPPTILSRCQHYNFRRIPRTEIANRLRYVAEQDGLTIEERSLTAIARASEGSMRDALSLLDQAVAFSGKTVRHDDVVALLGSVPQELVRDVMAAVVAHDCPGAIRLIAAVLDQGHDLRAFSSDIVEHVRNLLVASVVPREQELSAVRAVIDLPDEELRQLRADAASFSTVQLQDLLRVFSEVENGLRTSARPRFLLEAAVIRAAQSPATPTVTAAPGPPRETPVSAPATTPKPATSAEPRRDPVVPRAPAPHAPPAAPRSASTPDAPRRASERSATPNPPASLRPAPSAKPSPPTIAVPWERIVERVEQLHPNIGPFLAKAGFLGVEDNVVTLGYPRTASVALARVQREESIQLISHVCKEVVGRSLTFRVVELDEHQPLTPSIAELRAQKEHRHKAALLEETRAHPVVKQAVAMFGADVVEVRHRAAQQEEPTP